MHYFKTKAHQVYTTETERLEGSCYDYKRYFFADANTMSLAQVNQSGS